MKNTFFEAVKTSLLLNKDFSLNVTFACLYLSRQQAKFL
jgi:hypothetical protein